MSKSSSSAPLFLGMIAIGIIIGVVLTSGFNIDMKSHASEKTSNTVYTEGEMDGAQTKLTTSNYNPNQGFVDVVKQVRPTIVTIYTTTNVKIPSNPFHRFFRDFGMEDQQGGGNEDMGTQQEVPQQGLGSGVIVSSDGYILTNHHVIKDVDDIRVQLVDDREYEAKLIGTDPTTEIALIKIDADDLPVALLGDSDKLEIGEWVLAIGSPLELNFTVTAGIVSALSRDINIIRGRNSSYGIENFIQTDAAINPGNSGGALVNSRGQVIGINTAIATPTGNYVGYGFAVPVNIAKNVMDDFMKYGEVRRGYLGVYIEPMTPVKAKGVGLEKPEGVFISSVIEGKAAADAGIRAGDVVLEVEGLKVNKPNQLQAKVGSYDPDDKIEIVVWRDGKRVSFKVQLQGRDDQPAITANDNSKQLEKRIETLGIQLADLNSRELSRYDLDNGIVIQRVNTYSSAAKSGLSRSDVIYEMDGKAVESVTEFGEYIDTIEPGDVVKLQVRRKDSDGGNFDRLVFLEIPKE
jgi:serine protease Do